MTRVLIVGSGGREHALAWKLRQSPRITDLYVAPGNPGTAGPAHNLPVSATDLPGLVRLVREYEIDLIVVGPEAPLALGLADYLRAMGRRVVGPDAAAAWIESSKAFAKTVMHEAGVPTAHHAVFEELPAALRYVAAAAYPLVIKADGLTAGKGVTICGTVAEAEATLHALMAHGRFAGAGRRVVIEEYLSGPEVSLIAFVDGTTAVPLPAAQDHKRLGDGDTGPNTGGMGAYAPVPFLSPAEIERLIAQTLQPVVDALAARGTPYRGILYAGLMLTAAGPRVLEYNCRFGDPEAQVILPLLSGDLLPWLEAMAVGQLPGPVPVHEGAAVGVVLAAEGYPEQSQVGRPIAGLDEAGPDTLIFQAGTARDERGRIVTAGGRVLTIVGRGATVDGAAATAYRAPVRFEGMQYRRDIAWQARNQDTAPRSPAPPAAHTEHRSPRIAVLASGEGSNLQALIDASAAGRLDAQIGLVVSDNAQAGALRRAAAAGIQTAVVPLAERRDPAARRQHEAALDAVLSMAEPDLIVLAGWMLVLSAEFLARQRCELLNVHPALLPMAGSTLDVPVLRGAHAVRDALALGLPYTGVSVHRVTAEVDAGPVVAREEVRILPGDDELSLYRRIKAVEHRLLVAAVRAEVTVTQYGGVHA